MYMRRASTSLIPFCKDCIYFIPNKNLTKASCSKFTAHDVVSGQIKYDTAYEARQDPGKCDTRGIHFEPTPKQNPFEHFGGGL